MIKGKALLKSKEGLKVCIGYLIHDENARLCSIKDSNYFLFSLARLTRRLLRAEITGLYSIGEGCTLAVAKKGLYLKQKDTMYYTRCLPIPRGSKPLNLCITPFGNIFFGEYFQNTERQPVNIYCSKDNAKTWHVAYSFKAGTINHIHGLFFDKYTDRIWCTTGDGEGECIIGYTEDEFKNFVEVLHGGQNCRTCQVFFYPDFFVYVTDSPYLKNKVFQVDRKTLKKTELQVVQGTVIKGGQVGDVSFFSTTVEPSKVNKDRYAHLWVTKDGLHWEERYKAPKDWLPFIFQFGTFEFPQYYGIDKLERLYFSGRALKGLDGKSTYIDL